MSKLTGKSNTPEDIHAEFQTLRNDQRLMANKLTEMEAELNEHKIVIDTLKTVDPKRKCYRLIGGILCERTVEEVVPCLVTNEKQLQQVIKNLNEQITKKGTEINEFKKKHNITIRGEDSLQQKEKPKEDKRNAISVNSI